MSVKIINGESAFYQPAIRLTWLHPWFAGLGRTHLFEGFS
jgi:hypothetical protein